MSNLKVFVLLAGLTALFGIVGYGLGGQQGMLLALILAGIMNFIAYFNSDKMVLKAYQARIVSAQEAPELHAMIDRIRQRADLPMPTVALAPHRQPNAFATGRNPEHAVVCVTEGILELVDRDELEGVLAHEIGHIKNRDMLLNTVSATLAGAISYLARFGFYAGGSRREGGAPFGILAVFLAPLAAMLIQFTISRQREFKADRTGAELSGKPLALASALEKLEDGARRIPMRVSPAVAPLAQVNPLSAFGGLTKLFSTHPSTAERVARLREMAGASAFAA
jgi:heat shock protein HtpX